MRSSLLVPALLLLATATPVLGQDVPEARTVRASLDGRLGLQQLSEAALGTVSARLWLHFGEAWRIGFGGLRGLNRTDGGELESSGLEAAFGMATLSVARRLPFVEDGEASLTIGSGAISLENSVLGTTLDTETVWVLEPAIGWTFGTAGPIDLGVEAGHRWIFGSDGLTRLEGTDLGTFVLSLTLSFDRL